MYMQITCRHSKCWTRDHFTVSFLTYYQGLWQHQFECRLRWPHRSGWKCLDLSHLQHQQSRCGQTQKDYQWQGISVPLSAWKTHPTSPDVEAQLGRPPANSCATSWIKKLSCDIREIQNKPNIGIIQNICPGVQLRLEIVKFGFMVSLLTMVSGQGKYQKNFEVNL